MPPRTHPTRRSVKRTLQRERLLVFLGVFIVLGVIAGTAIIWRHYNYAVAAAYQYPPKEFIAQTRRVNIGDPPQQVLRVIDKYTGYKTEAMAVMYILVPDPRRSKNATSLPSYYIRVDFNEFKRVSKVRSGRLHG